MLVKRILLYSLNFSPELTGIGKFNGEMVKWLTDQGYEVRVVTAPPYYPQWKVQPKYSAFKYTKEKLNGATVWRCPLWVPNQLSGLKRVLHLASFACFSIPAIIRQLWWKPQLALVVEPPLTVAPVMLFISKLLRIQTWLHVQDFEVDAAFDLGLLPSNKALKYIVTKLETMIMRRFNIVSSISEQMMNRLHLKGVESARTRFFPNWVDIDLIYPLSESPRYYRDLLGIPANDFVVLYSGNLGAKQGLEIMIDAAERLRNHVTIHFVICGEGSIKEELMKEAGLRKLTQIKFMPLQPIDKLNLLLNTADVHALIQKQSISDLVMPSKLTGMLASGKAIIATAAEGSAVYTALKQSNAGLVVRPEDAKQLAATILEMSQSAEAAKAFGLQGRAYAINRLSIETTMKDFEAAFCELAATRKKGLLKSSVKDKGVLMK